MEQLNVAKLAISSVTYTIDRPYDYKIPQELMGKVEAGIRVIVPFGRGNRRKEGIVLSVASESGFDHLKCIESILDDHPVLSSEQLKLALWMRDRFFCTVFDAAHAMLPAGMWFKNGVRKIGDKTVNMAELTVPSEDAVILAKQKKLKAPQQSAILELLSSIGNAAVKEICYFTGASISSVKALERLGVISLEHVEVFRRPEFRPAAAADKVILNDDQMSAFQHLLDLMKQPSADAALLYGVTGSGKTSVYIKLIEEALQRGKSAIVLVPEIALTPQLMNTFSSHFGDNIAVLHSSLGIGERYDEWKRIRSGNVRVVVGTRSAVFAPVSDLGIIIMDEEQEHTYKSQNNPRYHARDVAKFRCVQSGALLLLGSATPSIESTYQAKEGRYKLFRLDNRYNKQELPNVVIADMKKELQSGNGSTIGSLLYHELKRNIERKEQSILFINRRGTNALVACGECGYTFSCPRCSVSETYHSANNRLMCHYCGFSEILADHCPSCGGILRFVGAGTQKVETDLMHLFPDTEIIRMDTDTVSAAKSHEMLFDRFRDKKIPILLGTQMVTKGLDFDNVTLVGVISADQSLHLNDYRAHERTFSLITQVVGRSGRGSKTGRAVIQTLTPDNEVIRLASRQDYDSFYDREIELRKIIGCPPIADLFSLTASGIDETAVLRGCVVLRTLLEKYIYVIPDIKLLGPAPASVTKVNNRFRYKISISCKNSRTIRDIISYVLKEFAKHKKFKGITVFADINPQD